MGEMKRQKRGISGLVPALAGIPNVRSYYTWTFLMSLTFWSPVIALFYQANHLSYAEMLTLQSVYLAVGLVVDIPTSLLSDVYGRKRLVQVATLVAGLGFTVYTLSSSFVWFIVAESLIGLASGTYRSVSSAFVYDSLVVAGHQSEDRNVLSSAYAVLIAGNVIASFIGAPVARAFAPRTTLLMTACACGGALLITCFFREPDQSSKPPRVTWRSLGERLAAGFRGVVGDKALCVLAVDQALLGAISMSVGWFTQPHLVSLGVAIPAIGVFYSVARLSAFFMIKLIPVLDKRGGFQPSVLAVRLPVPICLFALGLGRSPAVAFVCFGVLVVAMHMRTLLYGLHVNRAVSSEIRATTLSFVSFSAALASTALGPAIGALADRNSIQTTCLILGGVSATLILGVRLRPLGSRKEGGENGGSDGRA